MKNFLLIVSALMLTVSASAQLLKRDAQQKSDYKSPTAVHGIKAKANGSRLDMRHSITPSAGQFWWGYFEDNDASGLDYDGYYGYSRAATIMTGIYVPSNHAVVGSGKIVAVRFWLGDDISKISNDFTIWISKNGLPDNVSMATYKQTVPKLSLNSRLNEVVLNTPFEVNNSSFYIGFSFSITGRSYPVLCGGEDKDNSLLFCVGGGGWEDLSNEGDGPLAFQMLVDGVTLPSYSATPADFGTGYATLNGTAEVPIKITNYGSNPITSISYTISGGNSVPEKTISVDNLAFNSSKNIYVSFPADTEAKRYAKEFTITKVNGIPNEATEKSAHGDLITISEKVTTVPVVEEFTGTWCGWCPVGWDGMEKAEATYGDEVILIAAHYEDDLATNDYAPIMNYVSGFPSCFVDRTLDIYPAASILKNAINQQLARVSVGTISAQAYWQSDAKTSINIFTETKFVYNDDAADYGVAFIVVADGLTNPSWSQANYLSGRSGYESISFWYNAGSSVSGLTFNHVPVAAWKIENGFDNSISSVVRAGAVQSFSYTADISDRSIIQDKSKLSVVALLIDRPSGCIINAAKTSIGDAGTQPNGIHAMDNGQCSMDNEAVYNIAGQRLDNSQLRKGVYIVNGKKVLAK